jgi:hypothetical protein
MTLILGDRPFLGLREERTSRSSVTNGSWSLGKKKTTSSVVSQCVHAIDCWIVHQTNSLSVCLSVIHKNHHNFPSVSVHSDGLDKKAHRKSADKTTRTDTQTHNGKEVPRQLAPPPGSFQKTNRPHIPRKQTSATKRKRNLLRKWSTRELTLEGAAAGRLWPEALRSRTISLRSLGGLRGIYPSSRVALSMEK